MKSEERRAVCAEACGSLAVLRGERGDAFGHGLDLLNRADALARTPDVLPRLRLVAAEIHLRLVGFRQRVRIAALASQKQLLLNKMSNQPQQQPDQQ